MKYALRRPCHAIPVSAPACIHPAVASATRYLFLPLLAFILLSPFLLAESATGFTDNYLGVSLAVNRDGTSHVTEEVHLNLTPDAYRKYQDSLRSTALTLDNWRQLTGSRNMRHHILGGNVTPINTKLTPQRPVGDEMTGYSTVILLEYDTSDRVFNPIPTGPRFTRYLFRKEVLSFDNAPEGQVLAVGNTLAITPPTRATVDLTRTYPNPTYPGSPCRLANATMVCEARGIPLSLSQLDYTFEIEQTLDEEVGEFFADTQSQTTRLIFSPVGLLIALLAVILLAVVVVLRRSGTL